MSEQRRTPLLVYLTIGITVIGLIVLTLNQSAGLTVIFMAILLYGLVFIRNRLQDIGAEAFALGSVLVWLGFLLLALPLIAFAWNLFTRGIQIITFVSGILLIIFGYTTEYFELNALFLQWLIKTRDRLISAFQAIRTRFLRSFWTILALLLIVYDLVALFNPILVEFIPNPFPQYSSTPYVLILILAALSLAIEFREVIAVFLESILRFLWYIISAIVIRLKRFPDFVRSLVDILFGLFRNLWSLILTTLRYFRFNTYMISFTAFFVSAIVGLIARNTILGSSSVIFLLISMSSVVGQRREMVADRVAQVQQAAYQRAFRVRNLIRQSASGECPNCGEEVRGPDKFCQSCGKPVPSCLVCKDKILAGEETLTCSECGYSGHLDHIESWIKIRPICPNCKARWT